MGKHDIEIDDGKPMPTYVRGYLCVPITKERYAKLEQIAKKRRLAIPYVIQEWIDSFELSPKWWGNTP